LLVPAWRSLLPPVHIAIPLPAAGVISAGLWLYDREPALPDEAMAILVFVLLNALIDYLQQARAGEDISARPSGRELKQKYNRALPSGEERR
jgi:P-type Ca2+ transporter type 2C